jgi:sporadic carbohydrate cluster 2OG-Fe(II) oxygenase
MDTLSLSESTLERSTNPFFAPEEEIAIEQFLKDGYLIFDIDDRDTLMQVKQMLYMSSLELLNESDTSDLDRFYDRTHEFVDPSQLNDFRVKLIAKMAQQNSLKPSIYKIAKQPLHWLVGNELVMQRNCNLSIQFPGDESSLLPLHSDVWSGNSPYEVVLWLPLVNCYSRKSMFILPRSKSDEILKNFPNYSHLTAEALYQQIKSELVWLDVKYGQAAIFSHSLLHGNRVNDESETRWTINVRFKSLLSPYGSKGLGESFLPITLRPATRIGFNYQKPEC